MPLVFVHGVNVRETDPGFEQTARTRRKLLEMFLLGPLRERLGLRNKIEIIEPYWGRFGATFAWNMATLPRVRAFQSFGTDDDAEIRESDDIFAATVTALAAADSDPAVQEYGATDELERAASSDLRQFLEAVVTPVAIGESQLSDGDAQSEAALDAILAQAVVDVAQDPVVKERIAAGTAGDPMEILKEEVQKRFRELIPMGPTTGSEDGGEAGTIEHYGSDRVGEALARIGEMFDRANSTPLRAASSTVLALRRERLHRDIARFEGDVFVYIKERGERAAPGPIVSTVLDAITNARRNAPDDDPLIILTHSMGGNIVYDILTYYAPEIKVDLWVSVAGQVGLFEEMKLFKVSDARINTPRRVRSPLELGRWINVYDPLDILSFLAEPVFDDVIDEEYHTGANALKAHSEYFGRASFYDVMRKHAFASLRQKV